MARHRARGLCLVFSRRLRKKRLCYRCSRWPLLDRPAMWDTARVWIMPLPDRGSGKAGRCANSAIGSWAHAVTASWGIICLTQFAQVDREVGGGGQGVGVVVAQHPAAAVEGVLVQIPGSLHLAQRAQVDGQVVGGVQGVGVVVAEDAAAAGQGVVV